jgi:hypothetical protein
VGTQRFDHQGEQRFDEPTQQQIFQLAAELQKEEATSLSRTQMEEIAAEAGIDPKFVRRAVERIQSSISEDMIAPPSHSTSLTVLALAVLMVMNVYGASGTLSSSNPHFYLIFGYSIVAGGLASRTFRERFLTIGVSVTSVVMVLAWCVAAHKIGMGPDVENQLGYLCNYAGVQVIAILFGQGLAALIRFAERLQLLKSRKASP